jgi:hypothetical protein
LGLPCVAKKLTPFIFELAIACNIAQYDTVAPTVVTPSAAQLGPTQIDRGETSLIQGKENIIIIIIRSLDLDFEFEYFET